MAKFNPSDEKKFVFHRIRAYVLIDRIGYPLHVSETSIIQHESQ